MKREALHKRLKMIPNLVYANRWSDPVSNSSFISDSHMSRFATQNSF